jgi:hypothetical protein
LPERFGAFATHPIEFTAGRPARQTRSDHRPMGTISNNLTYNTKDVYMIVYQWYNFEPDRA